MTQQHPITPPQELVEQWEEDWHHSKIKHIELEPYIAAQAALEAAADQVVPAEEAMPLNLAYRVRWDALQSVRYQLLAIAAELKAHD